jgi:hypothetical protein
MGNGRPEEGDSVLRRLTCAFLAMASDVSSTLLGRGDRRVVLSCTSVGVDGSGCPRGVSHFWCPEASGLGAHCHALALTKALRRGVVTPDCHYGEAHQAMVAASEAASQTSIRNLTPDLPSMLMAKSHIQVTNELLGGLITQGEARDAEEKARKRTETRRFWITAGFALVAAVTGVWALPR